MFKLLHIAIDGTVIGAATFASLAEANAEMAAWYSFEIVAPGERLRVEQVQSAEKKAA